MRMMQAKAAGRRSEGRQIGVATVHALQQVASGLVDDEGVDLVEMSEAHCGAANSGAEAVPCDLAGCIVPA